MSKESAMPTKTHAKGESCGCPGGESCSHDGKPAAISIRAGFIICALGKEKLCSECVVVFGDVFKCHGSHTDGN